MKTPIQWLDQVNGVVRALVVAMFMAALAIIVGQVICRSVLHISIPWTEEVARYLTVYIVYFAASLAARHGKLTRLEVVVDALKLSPRGRKIVDRLAGAAAIAFYLVAAVATYLIMRQSSAQLSGALKIPMSVPYAGILIGCILLVFNTLACLMEPDQTDELGGVSE